MKKADSVQTHRWSVSFQNTHVKILKLTAILRDARVAVLQAYFQQWNSKLRLLCFEFFCKSNLLPRRGIQSHWIISWNNNSYIIVNREVRWKAVFGLEYIAQLFFVEKKGVSFVASKKIWQSATRSCCAYK